MWTGCFARSNNSAGRRAKAAACPVSRWRYGTWPGKLTTSPSTRCSAGSSATRSASIPTPTLTGEDIYLKEDFKKLCAEHAVSKIHPDLATAGGILETKKIGDLAMEFGVPMAMHFAGSPVSCMASVHCAAATENFLAL